MKNTTFLIMAALALAATLSPLWATAQTVSPFTPQLQPLLQGGNPRVSMTHVPIFDSVDTRGIHTMYLNVPYAHRSSSQYVDIYLPNMLISIFPTRAVSPILSSSLSTVEPFSWEIPRCATIYNPYWPDCAGAMPW